MSVIDDYLKYVDPSQRAVLSHIRTIVRQTVPKATETISYGLPAFKYQSKPLLYFGVFTHHMSLFPTSGPTEAFKDKLGDYTVTKGTIQFTAKKPLPDALLIEILQFRVKAIEQTQNP